MTAALPRSARVTGTPVEAAERREDQTTVYAGLVTRTIAFGIDALVIAVIAVAVAGAALLTFAVFAVTGNHHTLALVVGGVAFVIWVTCYFAGFWTTTGQTPGNRLMQIRVTRSDGARVRAHQALIRLGAMVLSLPLFWGYWPILTSARRRGVPDAMAGTVVVVADVRPPAGPVTHRRSG